MLKGVLAIAPNNSLVSDDRHRETVSGLVSIATYYSYKNNFKFQCQTPDEYEQQYRRRLQEERYQEMNLTEVVVAGTEFDAMWAIALGLHSASEKVRNNDSAGCEDLPGELLPLEHFEYVNDKMGCVLRKSFQQVSFSGITVSGHSIQMSHSPHLIFRGKLCLIVMEAGMQGSFVFNDISLQVQCHRLRE